MKIISSENCPIYTYDGIGYIVVGKEFEIRNFKSELLSNNEYYLIDKKEVYGYSFTELSTNEYCFIEETNFKKFITILNE